MGLDTRAVWESLIVNDFLEEGQRGRQRGAVSSSFEAALAKGCCCRWKSGRKRVPGMKQTVEDEEFQGRWRVLIRLPGRSKCLESS